MSPSGPIELPVELRKQLDVADVRRLRTAVGRLSRDYRAGRATDLRNDDDALAYACYRMPATYAAVSAALRATALALPDWTPRSLLDVGAGPGTAAWAATEVFPSLKDIVFVEREPRMQRLGRRMANADPVLRDANWHTAIGGNADLVVASYSLGEMDQSVAEMLWRATRAVLVVVEPGTPAGYGTVIQARDVAIRGGGRVAAPCPHSDACPMQRPSWCHFSQRLPRSGVHRSLKDASLSWEDEKFAYVAVSRFSPRPVRARVIGQPRYSARLVCLPVCTADGLEERLVPKSDQAYRAARRAAWGDEFGA